MKTENIDFQHDDSLELMKQIPDGSIDCILTDPPYKYLKHKLDRDWDEDAFFAEFKRVLKPKGMIALFGRGTSFYRWNVKLDALGFPFKEEIVWDKRQPTSPLNAIMRVHEVLSIHGNSIIKKNRVPYEETKCNNLIGVLQDVKRFRTILNNPGHLSDALNWIENNLDNKMRMEYNQKETRNDYTIGAGVRKADRALSVLQAFQYGHVEKDIIELAPNRLKTIHPTEKPVRLLERIMALISDEGDTVLDPFAGSASIAIAALNTGRKFIGYEIDDEYFALASKRLEAELQRRRSPRAYPSHPGELQQVGGGQRRAHRRCREAGSPPLFPPRQHHPGRHHRSVHFQARQTPEAVTAGRIPRRVAEKEPRHRRSSAQGEDGRLYNQHTKGVGRPPKGSRF